MFFNITSKLLISFSMFNLNNKKMKAFTSKKTNLNVVYLYFFNSNAQMLNILQKYENSFLTSLIDMTGFDSSDLTNYNLFFIFLSDFNKLYNFMINYNLMNYNNYLSTLFHFFFQKNFNNFSMEKLFFNANWLESELIEFLGCFFFKKTDTSNLLLDYNFLFNPLVRLFPVEGFQEIYFNFENFSLTFSKNEFMEL